MNFRKKFPAYQQLDSMDCGPICMKILAEHYGLSISWREVRKDIESCDGRHTLMGLAKALEEHGFESWAVLTTIPQLIREFPFPLIALWPNNHFVVVYRATRNRIYVSDPAMGLLAYTHGEFQKHWSPEGRGVALLLEKKISLLQREKRLRRRLAFLRLDLF